MEDSAPYRGRWELTEVRRYFARAPVPLALSLVGEHADRDVQWREVSFANDFGRQATATVVLPTTQQVVRGVVLAHGGSDDGRKFFLSEAAALAARGAAVILPVTRMRQHDGVDAFAADVRNAVLTERAALDVLIEFGAPAGALSFLGHSAGGAYAAVLSAVEPRLVRIVIFANGAGPLTRSAMALGLSQSPGIAEDLAVVTDWFDLAHFVGVDRRAELCVQHGRADLVVPMAAARALFEAAAPPKLWMEYDWDHGLDADPQARQDRAEFVFSALPAI